MSGCPALVLTESAGLRTSGRAPCQETAAGHFQFCPEMSGMSEMSGVPGSGRSAKYPRQGSISLALSSLSRARLNAFSRAAGVLSSQPS
jgi:hypothetical protein